MESLFLNSFEYNKFLNFKETVGFLHGIKFGLPDVDMKFEDFLTNDVLVVSIIGDENSVKNAIAYIDKKLAPEETGHFYFPEPLQCIFRNHTWHQIMSKVYNVDAKYESPTSRLCICGTKDDVNVAISEMTVLLIEYDKASKNIEKCNSDVKVSVPEDILLPPIVKSVYYSIQHLPVVTLNKLVSWLIKIFRQPPINSLDSTIILNDSLETDSADQSIMIIETPTKEIPLVEISDDENTNKVEEPIIKKKRRKKQTKQQCLMRGLQRILNMQKKYTFFKTRTFTAINSEIGKKSTVHKTQNTFTSMNNGIGKKCKRQKNQRLSTVKKYGIRKNCSMPKTQRTFTAINNGIRKRFTMHKTQKRNTTAINIGRKNHMSIMDPKASTSTGDILMLDSNTCSNFHQIMRPQTLLPNPPLRLRPVVIDGNNVAHEHGTCKTNFSCKGIKLSIDYFLNRGHSVVAFVPRYRDSSNNPYVKDHGILQSLLTKGLVVLTPSRKINGKAFNPYDDRFIVKHASNVGGVILSNDNYRDIMNENPDWKKTIEERLLMYCFVGDTLMIPDDPLGKEGPRLTEFLSFPELQI